MAEAVDRGAQGPSPLAEIDSGVAYFQGRFVPLAEANVNIATHALNYGTGCFEGIRAYWNAEAEELYVLMMEAHYRRFLNSCRLLRIECPLDVSELVALTCELLRRNGMKEDTYIRPLAFKASKVIKVALTGLRDAFAVFCAPMGDYVSVGGLSVQVSAWQRIPDNAVPSRSKTTGSYVNAALAVDQAKLDGYDEAILLSHDGHVAEGSGANVFLVRGDTLVTPPVTADILEGVTRTLVLALARDLGWRVEVRSVDRTELYTADEVFLTGTGAQIAPVTEIDRRPIGSGGIGPVVRRLQEVYFRAVRGMEPRYHSWLTPVYGREG